MILIGGDRIMPDNTDNIANKKILNKINNVDLPNKLKEIRAQKGKTMQEVADLMNISPQAYSRYENNKSSPTLDTLLKMADAFQIHLFELFMPAITNNAVKVINYVSSLTFKDKLKWKKLTSDEMNNIVSREIIEGKNEFSPTRKTFLQDYIEGYETITNIEFQYFLLYYDYKHKSSTERRFDLISLSNEKVKIASSNEYYSFMKRLEHTIETKTDDDSKIQDQLEILEKLINED